MPYLTDRAGPDHRPIRLTTDEKNNPWEVLESFFWNHSLGDLRTFFANVKETCLTTDDGAFAAAEKRADLLLYCREIATFLEAAWLIILQRDKARQRHYRRHRKYLNTIP